MKNQLGLGTTVLGEVVVANYYGRFLDIARGFPALLNAVDNLGLVPDLPQVGSRIGVVITEFCDREREIVVNRPDRTRSTTR